VNIQRDEIVRAVSEANVEATRAASDAEARLKAALGLGPDVASAPQAAPKSAAPKPTGAKAAGPKPTPTTVPRPPAQR
jgi:carbon storage regulator